MVVIKSTDIAPIAGQKATEALPKWLTKAEDIVKGINQLFDNYYAISGKTPPTIDKVEPTEVKGNTPAFSEARAAKKTEMAQNKPDKETVMPDMFKELLTGMIKTCDTLETMKLGDKQFMAVLNDLPMTVTQLKDFFSNLYKKHYGG